MTQPTGLLHPDWTISPWKGCKEHWDRVRAGLKPPQWSPQPATVFMEVSDNEDADLRRFREQRSQALLKQRKDQKPWAVPVVTER